jgi:hypothetical protein
MRPTPHQGASHVSCVRGPGDAGRSAARFVAMNIKTFCIFSLILVPVVCFGGPWRVLDSRGTQKPETLNEVDFRVRNVGLGSRRSSVLRQFGKPLTMTRERVLDETCGPPYTSLRLKYSGLVIRLEGDIRGRHFRVVSVEVNSPQLLLSPIRIGMTEQEVRSRLSPPWQERNESGFHILNYATKGNDGGAGLYFREGKLMKVQWEATLC